MRFFGFGKKKRTRPFNFFQYNGLTPQEMDDLCEYNSYHGKLHFTKEYEAEMSVLQKRFDDHRLDPKNQKIIEEMTEEL